MYGLVELVTDGQTITVLVVYTVEVLITVIKEYFFDVKLVDG